MSYNWASAGTHAEVRDTCRRFTINCDFNRSGSSTGWHSGKNCIIQPQQRQQLQRSRVPMLPRKVTIKDTWMDRQVGVVGDGAYADETEAIRQAENRGRHVANDDDARDFQWAQRKRNIERKYSIFKFQVGVF